MGYCISINDSKFAIRRKHKDAAFEAVKRAHSAPTDVTKQGGDKFGRKSAHTESIPIGGRFAWLPEDYISRCSTLEEVFEEWRYPVETNDFGDITGIDFYGEKIGDEVELFRVIAPFVESGSYLEMHGEDGAFWRWVFKNGTFAEVDPIVKWE